MATRAVKKADDSLKGSASRSAVIPVIQEQATAYKRVVETGKVRISKHVREYEELVDIPHFQEEVKVERVPVNQLVETAPSVRTEGDVTIIPILEEKYVLEKKLVLVEELHIRKERNESHRPQKVKVLKEEVEVNRIGPRGSTDASAKPNRGRERDLRR
jgi:uncharacterized protein (TIGR02271 family)